MVVAGPYADGGGHYAVVVVAFDGAHLAAVLLDFVKVELVAGGGAVLDVQVVAKALDEVVYYHWLCRRVGVETPTAGTALLDVLVAGAAVEVIVMSGYLVEDILEVVALGAFGLHCVGLDDEQGVVVALGYLCGFPG